MANRNWSNGMKIAMMESAPVILTCNFIVDSANGNGLGIRRLKGAAIKNVYMHTSATPAVGNPNPASGSIVLQLANNFNRSLCGFNTIVSPVSGTPLTATTAGTPVVIVSLGTATVAQWRAVGLPIGIAPAVGVSFVPTSSATIGGSAAVEIAAAAGSGIMSIETLGDPNLSIAPNPNANQGYGASMILQCRNISGAIAAPADGTVITLTVMLSNSSVTSGQGE